MIFETNRLFLRPWEDGDAEELYRYAKDPAVGPIAGWPPHTDVRDSLRVIQTVLSAPETYAVVLKTTGKPVGSVGILFDAGGNTAMTDSEAEIGYWIGVPHWGQGLIPEAVDELLRRCFEDLGRTGVWCGYYNGNVKSKRAQEKCGFLPHHDAENQPCELMGDTRTIHYTYQTRAQWESRQIAKPVLVVMAAGMGSRYGGLKQLVPVGSHGELIIDYSIYDAHRAGFETVIFVIKRELEELFRSAIGDRISKSMKVLYAYQEIDDLPPGYTVPEGRTKPWGTAHAVLAARKLVDGPFAVINSDDYYGPEAYREIYEYLSATPDGPAHYEFAMVGYLLKNTVTDNGSVSRGVCTETADGFLNSVTERVRIEKGPLRPRYTEDGGATWTDLSNDTVVSLNLFGFTKSYMAEAWARFPAFLDNVLRENPFKGEYFLPSLVGDLLAEDRARVKVLRSHDKWYGVTYPEDSPAVVAALADFRARGLYPETLWTI